MTALRSGKASGTAAAAIAPLYTLVLLLTAKGIGYSRDESFYFDAADRYIGWFKLLMNQHDAALKRWTIDSSFSMNHEHPPLMKTLFGLSHEWLFEQHHWFSQPGLSYRFPTMVIAGVGVAVLVRWGTRTLSIWAGIMAGLGFALMPRIFHHAHLACFDVPVACLCAGSAYLWSRALESGKWRWTLALGVVYGLTLATKHNAWMLPPAFFLHGLIVKGGTFLKSSWLNRLRILAPAVSLLTIGPLVLYALWPWLWFETAERLKFWFEFHLKHEYYNMEFLGVTYWKPPMPIGYAWLMTLATVPLATLVLFLIGGFYGTRNAVSAIRSRVRLPAEPVFAERRNSDFLLWVICLIAFYSPWLSRETPIFGGTKHWFSAYPFLCLIAARGFESLREMAPRLFPDIAHNPKRTAVATALGVTLVLSPGFVIIYDMGPWGLSTYTPAVGGASGAATLGLNRTFWGYTTLAVAPELSAHAPARVFLHDTTLQAWNMQVRDGALNKTLYGTNSVVDSDMALYHHEPHMGRVEYQIWAAYGSATPAAVGAYHGVPVVWLYARHRFK